MFPGFREAQSSSRRFPPSRYQETGPHRKSWHRLAGDPRDQTRGAAWEMLHVAIRRSLPYRLQSGFHANARALFTIAFLPARRSFRGNPAILLGAFVTHLAASPYTFIGPSTHLPGGLPSTFRGAQIKKNGDQQVRCSPLSPGLVSGPAGCLPGSLAL